MKAQLSHRQVTQPQGRTVSVARGCRTPAELQRDIEAIGQWIDARASNSEHTARAYRKEQTRLLSWMARERPHWCLEDLQPSDILELQKWLNDPPKWALAEGLFRGKPCDASLFQSLRVLHSLFGYLADTGRIPYSVFREMRLTKAPKERSPQPKSLDETVWSALVDEIDAIDAALPREGTERKRFELRRGVVLLLYYTGMRREELADARLGDLSANEAGMLLTVRGKGGVTRLVPFVQPAVETLRRLHLRRQGLSLVLPAVAGHSIAMVPSRKTRQKQSRYAMTGSTIARHVKALFFEVAARWDERAKGQEEETARALLLMAADVREKARAHRLRHTHGSHYHARGGHLKRLQETLGHADINTTTIYVTEPIRARQLEAERIFKRRTEPTSPSLPAG
jgi:integrase/recombinase XerD